MREGQKMSDLAIFWMGFALFLLGILIGLACGYFAAIYAD